MCIERLFAKATADHRKHPPQTLAYMPTQEAYLHWLLRQKRKIVIHSIWQIIPETQLYVGIGGIYPYNTYVFKTSTIIIFQNRHIHVVSYRVTRIVIDIITCQTNTIARFAIAHKTQYTKRVAIFGIITTAA